MPVARFVSLDIAFIVAAPVWGHPPLPTKKCGTVVVEKAEHGVGEAVRVDKSILACLQAMVSAGAVQGLSAVWAESLSAKSGSKQGRKQPRIAVVVAERCRNSVNLIPEAVTKKPMSPIIGEGITRLPVFNMWYMEDKGVVRATLVPRAGRL